MNKSQHHRQANHTPTAPSSAPATRTSTNSTNGTSIKGDPDNGNSAIGKVTKDKVTEHDEGASRALANEDAAAAVRVLRYLDQMEEELSRAGGWLGQRLVNEEVLFQQLSQLRHALPPSLHQAVTTLRERQEMLVAAQQEAQRIQETARQEAEHLRTQAQQQAHQQVATAQAERQRLLGGAAHTAREIIQQARQQAEQLVLIHPLTVVSQQAALSAQQQASQEAQAMRASAETYGEEVLERVRGVLLRLQQAVEHDKAQLTHDQ
ncbi:MAG: hypothetical protein JOZ57_06610 [Abitibacteriaceae bacterium]|nr:hypothetical protein [Abditibacteriaceae bacterium]